MDIEPYKTPGQLLEALLAEREWSKRVLAVVIGMDETAVNRMTSDKRPITADDAVALEEVFGVPADRFLSLQKSYDLAMARIKARPDPKRSMRAQLFGGLPIAEMIKRGWINAKDVKDVAKVEGELAKFFGAESSSEIELLPHAAKKTRVVGDITDVQLAWLYRVKQIASELLVKKYSQAAVDETIPKLSALLNSREEIRKVPRILAEAGIRFVIVESLPSAKIDGVCFWLNDKSPVIGMSLRYDRIDNFWFVLRHELEHVIQKHGMAGAIMDAELEGERAGVGADVPEHERIANQASSDFCVPPKLMKSFVASKAPYFAEKDIIAFAHIAKVHPGLVAGQIRHLTGKYNLFANHLVKIRDVIIPNSAVDGWGDAYPVEAV